MFTQTKEQFGFKWTEQRGRSQDERRLASTLLIFVGIAAFIGWMLCAVTSKVTRSLYLTSLYPVTLTKTDDTAGLHGSRPHALSVVLKKDPNRPNEKILIMDSGESFLLNAQKDQIRGYIKDRAAQLEVIALLTMANTPGSGRVQIWPEENLQFADLNAVSELFVENGFDDFDIAVEPTSDERH